MLSINWNCPDNWFSRRSTNCKCPDKWFWRLSTHWNCPDKWFRRLSINRIIGTINLEDGLSIGIVRTIHFWRLCINCKCPDHWLPRLAYKFELPEQLTFGHFSKELASTIEPCGGLLIRIVWTIELDEFQLTGITDHNTQSIAIGN